MTTQPHSTPPWCHNATNVIGQPTALACLQSAGLDFTVSRRDVFVQSTDGASMVSVPGRFAVVREDTQSVLGVVGTQFRPFQNREAFGFMDEAVRCGAASYDAVGFIGDGQKVWMLVRLPHDIWIKQSEVLGAFILICATHDGERRFSVDYILRRKLTGATLLFSDGSAIPKVRHSELQRPEHLNGMEIVTLGGRFFKEKEALLKRLAARKHKSEHALEYLRSVYNRTTGNWKAEATLVGLIQEGAGSSLSRLKGTVWRSYCAVLEHEDFKRHHSDPDNRRISEVWFGGSAETKRRAFAVAVMDIE